VTAPAPRLFVVARPVLDAAAIERFLADEGVAWRRSAGATAAEEVVELAGRVCYFSFGERQSPRTNAEYIANLVRQGHESVLEHASWSFLLAGVSRAFTHQFVRHRAGFSYSQLSQQYHDESAAEVVMPAAIRRDAAAATIWSEAVGAAHTAYRELLATLADALPQLPEERERLRLLRTAARSVLPAATETKLVFSANARALRHFLALRGDIPGDEEMRVVSALLLDALQIEAPALFADFARETGPDGLPVVRARQDGER
jgi:thymidylate synthase (FAD)